MQTISLPGLSAEELVARVEQLGPIVAVFDCDGTLWSGDAGSGFMRWTIERGLISREMTDWIDARYRAYDRGEVSELAICGEMVQIYQGLRDEEMRRAAAAFFREQIEGRIFPEMQSLVDRLQRGGTTVWAVSSTCDWVIEEGVRRFGIPPERVLAARVAVSNGVVSERILEVPTDEGKVDALRRVGVTGPDAVFGNSVHDAAMLAIGRQAFPINPTPALLELSVERRWEVFYPTLVRPTAPAL